MTKTATITVLSDYVVTNNAYSPAVPTAGTAMSFSGTVKNQGGVSTIASYADVRLLLGADGLTQFQNVRLNNRQPTGALGAGGSEVETWSNAWTATPGTHALFLCADAGNDVPETDENNNCPGLYFTVLGPDFLVSAPSVSPSALVAPGTSMSFSGTVKNQGIASSAIFTSRLRLDVGNNGTWDVTDATHATGPLTANAIELETWPSFWAAQTGTHKFEICADTTVNVGSVSESNETNNCTTQTFTLLPPDFLVQSLSLAPASPAVGSLVSFSGTVKNQGGGSNAIFTSRLRLDVGNNGTWDVTDATHATGPLAAGATELETWANVWTAQTGTHKFEICADAGSSPVTESTETNNCATQTFTALAPDFLVQNLTSTPNPAAGGVLMSFSGTVKNQGGGSTASSSTDLRIDIGNDGAWDAVFALKATGPLAAGATQTFTWSNVWTAKVGTHRFMICADHANNVGTIAEFNETNNCMIKTFTVR